LVLMSSSPPLLSSRSLFPPPPPQKDRAGGQKTPDPGARKREAPRIFFYFGLGNTLPSREETKRLSSLLLSPSFFELRFISPLRSRDSGACRRPQSHVDPYLDTPENQRQHIEPKDPDGARTLAVRELTRDPPREPLCRLTPTSQRCRWRSDPAEGRRRRPRVV
jgi:hypothetical protein